MTPDEAQVSLGDALVRTGHLDAAIDCYRKALSISPDMPQALTQLARALSKQGSLEEAETLCRRVNAVAPGFADGHLRLGKILLERGRIQEGFASFTRSAELARPGRLVEGSDGSDHKSAHDREQRAYLASIGIGPDAKGEIFHLAAPEGRELPASPLNRANGAGEVAQNWHDSSPGIVVIDDFLSDEALANLRRFCWASTIWGTPYKRGYLEAFLGSGISCPLLAQIAEALPRTHPEIFGGHPLWMFWGFKYDPQLLGVGTHADSAVINVNLWITPDEANLDPGSGGLIIWEAPPPPDWHVSQYNSGDPTAARDFVDRSGARAVTIPYRSNRAVIFDSHLFHETDRIAFREGYLNRRINITLLYGRGELAHRNRTG